MAADPASWPQRQVVRLPFGASMNYSDMQLVMGGIPMNTPDSSISASLPDGRRVQFGVARAGWRRWYGYGRVLGSGDPWWRGAYKANAEEAWRDVHDHVWQNLGSA